jgi:hypothetical protein
MFSDGSMRLLDADRFQAGYMRNNKPSGQKNVRCFPCCSEGGHVKQQVGEERHINACQSSVNIVSFLPLPRSSPTPPYTAP